MAVTAPITVQVTADDTALVASLNAVRRERKSLLAAVRRTNRALARLEDRLADMGIKLELHDEEEVQ